MTLNRAAKQMKQYEEFKKEAKVITLKSQNSTKRVVKWRGRIFNTASVKEVFQTIVKETK